MKNLCALIGISFFAATSAWAQGAAAPVEAAPVVGQVEFGGRVSRITGDSARYERYRDLRNGPTLDRFRYERKHDTWEFLARVDHAGYRDQRYVAEFKQYGKLKADFTWDEVPFFYANSTQAVTTSPSPGVFRLNDGLQLALQNRATTGATTALYSADLRRFDLRSQRSTARAALDYRATRTLDLRWSLTSTDRTGSQPWGVSFGQSNAIEVAAPVDRRSNDMNATAEWSNQRAMARLAYDGSWFNNRVDRKSTRLNSSHT